MMALTVLFAASVWRDTNVENKSAMLRQAVADFLRIEPSAIQPDLQLPKSSIQMAIFSTKINRMTGLAISSILAAETYADLEAVFTGASVPATPQTAVSSPVILASIKSGASCGIDIESVDALPVVKDYWEDAFYKQHFSSEEIAWCQMLEQPLMHLAGRWSAKEALRKCDGAFLNVPFNTLEVVSDGKRAPFFKQHLVNQIVDLPHALSITHTPLIAASVVVLVSSPPASALKLLPERKPDQDLPPVAPNITVPVWFCLVFSSLALAAAVWALIRNI